MLADVMPNVLALAPYESVFGLACSCRVLSLVPIEREQYEVDTPFADHDNKIVGATFGYPNGLRLRLCARRITDNVNIIATYLNDQPCVVYVITDDANLTVVSLDTGVCCAIRDKYIGVGGSELPVFMVEQDCAKCGEGIPDVIVPTIASLLIPLFEGDHDTEKLMRAVMKAIDVYARHVGVANGTMLDTFGEKLSDILHERLRWN